MKRISFPRDVAVMKIALTCVTYLVLCLTLPVSTYGQFTLLHEFQGGAGDGNSPATDSLVRMGSTLYGLTSGGGDSGRGAVYSIETDGSKFQVLHSITPGITPFPPGQPRVLTLHGTTLYVRTLVGGVSGVGCPSGCGSVFSIETDGSNFQTLHDFAGGVNGHFPTGQFAVSGSTLFGTTARGGFTNCPDSHDCGTVFSMETDGSNFQVLHRFDGIAGDAPIGGVTLNGTTLFGATKWGGVNDSGTVFSVETDGSNFQTLQEFGPSRIGPESNLTLSGSTLYGTMLADFRFSDRGGALFSIETDGSNFQLLHEFPDDPQRGSPASQLTQKGDTLYGTTNRLVFSIETDGSNYQTLYDFTVPGAGDGDFPIALILDGSNLFGTTRLGGPTPGGNGVVFSLVLASISDLTNNGFVDFDDLSVLLANWDDDASAALGNIVSPDETVVNFDDLAVLLTDWTGPDPAGSPEAALGEAAVPEPSTLVLALLATLGLSFYRRRRRRAF